MKNIYRIVLVNDQGCCFDNGTFTNLKHAKKWAKDRSGDYSVKIYNVTKDPVGEPDVYLCRNNRLLKIC